MTCAVNIIKTILFSFLAIFHFGYALAQPNLIWARQTGGKDYSSAPTDKGTGIVLDEKGNSYVSGNFWGSSDFDPGPGTFWLNSGGVSDVFVAKYNPNGQFVWARRMGGMNYNDGNDIAIDKKGFLYLTGKFQGVSDFSPGKPEFTLTPSGYSNAFVCKMDTNGNMIWAKQLGGVPGSMDQIQGTGVAVDDSGNVYSAGLFGYNPGGGVDLDPGPGTFYPIGKGDFDIYISKLDKNGNFVWGKNLGTTGRESVNKIAVNKNGDVFLTGYFKNKMDFDPGPGEFFLQGGLFDNDIFICKLSKQGELMWAKRIGGNGNETGNDIHIDSKGNILTTGEFSGFVDFDPGDSLFTLIGNSRTAFVSKLTNDGKFIWAGCFKGGYSTGYGISSDQFNNIYFTGDVSVTPASPCDLDPGPGEYLISRAYNSPDIFICKLDSTGKFITGGSMGGANGIVTNKGLSIVADQSENILVTGTYTGQTPDFDPNPDPFAVFYMKTNSMDDEDIFICKYGTPKTRQPVYPTAAFDAPVKEICQGSCIKFQDKSINAEQWNWKFPGAATSQSNLQNPSNICYPDTGTYPVSLKVKNADGEDSTQIADYIRVIPRAKSGLLVAASDSLCIGLPLEIKTSGSSGPIQWQRATNGTDYENINHSDSLLKIESFEATSSYRVISSSPSCPDTSIVLRIVANPLPDTDFTITGGNYNKIFIPSISDSPGTKYNWDFGDNSQSTERSPEHLYRFPGDYKVCLQITSDNGCTASSCQNNIVGNLTTMQSHQLQGFSIHLNQFDQTISIQNLSGDNQNFSTQLFDLYGRLISTGIAREGNSGYFCNLWGLPPGIFILRLESKGFIQTIRFENIRFR